MDGINEIKKEIKKREKKKIAILKAQIQSLQGTRSKKDGPSGSAMSPTKAAEAGNDAIGIT